MELGVLLIPLLILLSGAIALVGNAVGRNIGRRRLSLVGLRPRYTAQIVTVVTGMLITIVTLIVVLLISSEARVALFRLNAVLRQTRQLEEEIHRQEDRLKQLALGDIAYLSNQEVLRDVIDGRQPREVISSELLRLADQSALLARGRVLPPPFTIVTASPAAQVDIDEHRAAVARIQRAGRQVFIRVVAVRDVYTVGPLSVSFTVVVR